MINKTITIYFLIDQTERMGEHASTMKELLSLVAIAHSRLWVTAVRIILVNLIQLVKIMELVLSILLTLFRLQDANVMEILLEPSVTKNLVVLLVIITEYVMVKLVNAVKKMELQNIMVKVVKYLVVMNALEIHVRMEGCVLRLFRVKFRPVPNKV